MTYDVIIIGSGPGGGGLAYALKNSGMNVLLIERGDFLPQEPENWLPEAVISAKRYQADEAWIDVDSGKPFRPATYYYVGGNTKMYGAALPRFRERDFEEIEFEEGTSPAWPIRYADLAPYYAQAERLFHVHADAGADPTEPARAEPYPFPALPREHYAEHMADKLRAAGARPFALPMAVDLRDGGRCIRCATCDGFPCKLLAKGDADACLVRPALQSPTVTLQTRTIARRLLTDPAGKRITAVEVERDGQIETLRADTFVVACGATNSAALLLRSANSAHPNGLANHSGLVGRNYMAHINSTLLAIDPERTNDDVYQKTIAVNDFYFGTPEYPYPMGNLQVLGKIQAGGYIAAARPDLTPAQHADMNRRSADWWVMSEDLPDPENRITLAADGSIRVRRRFKNMRTHLKLVEAATDLLTRAGYREIIHTLMPVETNSHQCGTARFGSDPATSVLDPFCKAWDVENLYVVDASFFPSSTAMNPALTVVAQALRVGEEIVKSQS
ncbi:MAG: GMC family oxidoreductase [Chloroflexi bacterium]|nr:GMC family oxidoreductase [Chloroflexota bacterium]